MKHKGKDPRAEKLQADFHPIENHPTTRPPIQEGIDLIHDRQNIINEKLEKLAKKLSPILNASDPEVDRRETSPSFPTVTCDIEDRLCTIFNRQDETEVIIDQIIMALRV